MKLAIVVPHIYMWDKVLKNNIFAPGDLAISLADRLVEKGHNVTLFTTGPVQTKAKVVNIDLKGIQAELRKHEQNLSYLIKEDLQTFQKLFRLIELEIMTKALKLSDSFDLIHVYYTSGPEAPILSQLSNSPIIFTLHDPFKMNFPNRESDDLLENVTFTAISNQQRSLVPDLNVISTVYNGIDFDKWKFNSKPEDFFIHYGRIIQPKGTHHAIEACKRAEVRLKIVGPHYEGHGNDHYWSQKVEPQIDNKLITYEGYITTQRKKNELLGNAKALLFPITWDEPFGLVIIEANACGTPVIAFDRGSVSEIIKDGVNGFVVKNVKEMVEAIKRIETIDRSKCREYVMQKFSIEKMVKGYENVYQSVINAH